MKQKPLDIQEPTLVDATGIEDLLAFMAIGSVFLVPDGTFSESWYLKVYANECESLYMTKGISGSMRSPTIVQHYQNEGPCRKINDKPNAAISLCTGQSLRCGIGPSNNMLSSHESHGQELALSHTDIKRWELVAKALKKVVTIEDLARFRCDVNGRIKECQGFSLDGSNLVPNFGEKWSDDEGAFLDFIGSRSDMIPGSVLPLIYGGIHLTAWNYTFPSTVEHILWKISGIGIMAISPFIIAVRGVLSNFDNGKQPFVMLLDILVLVSGFVFVSYLVFRTFIVLEAFLSLRHSPLGVYAAIPWVQNLPHL